MDNGFMEKLKEKLSRFEEDIFAGKDIDVKEFYKLKRLRKKIRSFPYLAEGTRTDLALTLADLELFSEQGGDRLDKPDVLIVITDGRTHPVLSKPYPEVLQPLQVNNPVFCNTFKGVFL